MRPTLQGLPFLVLFMGSLVAVAAPPQDKEDASDVITGTVQTITKNVNKYEDGRVETQYTATITKNVNKYEDGRVETQYTALIDVESVEKRTMHKGRFITANERITARWSLVKWPSRTIGHNYDVKEKATIRAYLGRQCGGEGFYVIDNVEGIKRIDP